MSRIIFAGLGAGVLLTGNQIVDGVKTFSKRQVVNDSTSTFTAASKEQAMAVYNNGTKPNFLEFYKDGFGERGSIGALGEFEMNVSYNMDYKTGVHKYYDSTKNAFWFALGDEGVALQYAPAGYAGPNPDIWYGTGMLYNWNTYSNGNSKFRNNILTATGSELIFKYDVDADEDGYINFHGFQGGSTRYRDTYIGNGKGQATALFHGQSQSMFLYGNQIIFKYDTDSDQECYLNYSGYNNGTTRFRDTYIGNGKHGILTHFDAINNRLRVGNGVDFLVGSNATTGQPAGVLAASTDSYIILSDQTGTKYKIPCKAV